MIIIHSTLEWYSRVIERYIQMRVQHFYGSNCIKTKSAGKVLDKRSRETRLGKRTAIVAGLPKPPDKHPTNAALCTQARYRSAAISPVFVFRLWFTIVWRWGRHNRTPNTSQKCVCYIDLFRLCTRLPNRILKSQLAAQQQRHAERGNKKAKHTDTHTVRNNHKDVDVDDGNDHKKFSVTHSHLCCAWPQKISLFFARFGY